MKTAVLIGTVVLAMSATSALAQTAEKAASSEATRTQAAVAGSDRQFVMDVAKNGLAEVELGKLAIEKASSDDVKKFGRRMVDDHEKANGELKTLAHNKTMTLPTEVDGKAKALHDRLSKLSGEAFDRAYMKTMLNNHRKAVLAFRIESRSGKDGDVKAWASKTLPTLEDHLKEAQDANNAVGTSGSTATKPKPKS